MTGQQVSVNQVILAQNTDAFSKLPDPPRVHQVDRSAAVVKELNQWLVINMGGLNDEGQ